MDIKNSLKTLGLGILFIVVGIFDLYTGGPKSTIYGIFFLITGCVNLYFSISNIWSYHKRSKEINNFVNGHSGTNIKADCNDYVDSIGFNKIYKYAKNINFCDGIEEKTNGPVEEYLHGVFFDKLGYFEQGFYILKFRNIKFPTFYSYDVNNDLVENNFKAEIDNDPIIKYKADYSLYDFAVDDEEVRKTIEEAKKHLSESNDSSVLNEENNEEDNDEEDDDEEDFFVNGKHTNLINRFFNKDVIKDFSLLSGLTDYVESRDQYLIFISHTIYEIEERHKCMNKLLDIAKDLEQHVDNEFRNEL